MPTLLHPAAKAARLRRARGIPGYADAPAVAEHVRNLIAAGWTRQQIAAASDVTARTLHGERPGIQQATAARILALRPRDAPGLVCAAGTARRLQALAAAGWPVTWTARQIGVPGPTLRELANGGHARVNPAVAAAVAEVFRAHAMRPGPSAYTRTVAARNGWVMALAWDDIDNPYEAPRGQEGRRLMAAPRELDLTVTLEAAWQSWEIRLRSLVDADQMSPDTTRGYLAYSRRAIDHLGPDRTIDSIDAAEISGWLIAYRARGRGDRVSSPDTIRFCRKSINGLMAYAESRRWLRENPMRDVPRAPMPTRTTRPERAALARHELDAMLAAARAGHGSFNGDQGCWVRDEIAVRLAGESGLRNADIRDLDIDDIEKDPAGHWVVQIRRGKGRKAATVPVTDECATLITTYIEQWRPEPGALPDRRDRHGKLFKGDTRALLLTAERHRFNTASVGHIVGRCAKAALGRHYVPHGLRHTTGTLLVREAKADLAIVAHVLRHSDISVTSVYLDTSNDEAAAAINRRKIGKLGSAASRQALPPGQDVPTWPEDCGTRRGWQRHRREKVPRCGPCRYWHRGAQEELAVLRRLMPDRLHGTVSGFRDWKCRCGRCRAARALSDSPDCRLVLPPRPAAPKELCPGCGKRRSLTAAQVMRRHPLDGADCPGSGQKPETAPLHLATDTEPEQDTERDEAA